MINLFPAVDILDGCAVRLFRGLRDEVTVYGSPLEMAMKWEESGSKWLHTVDLNGAFDGKRINNSHIEKIAKRTSLKIQVGGGIRTLDAIAAYLDAGVTRCVLGTAIFSERDFLENALARFGSEKIVCGMDVKDGKIALKGWVETADATAIETGHKWKQMGVRTVVFTDISRDGALSGVNVNMCKELSDTTGLDVIASGGLKNIDDVIACNKENLYGVILGKALYEGTIDLKQAIEISCKK